MSEKFTPEEIKKAKEQEMEEEGKHLEKELRDEREDHEQSQETVPFPLDVLVELKEMARRGEGELMNMSKPRLENLKRLFREIFFKVDEYMPEEPAEEESSAEKTEG